MHNVESRPNQLNRGQFPAGLGRGRFARGSALKSVSGTSIYYIGSFALPICLLSIHVFRINLCHPQERMDDR